MGTIITKPGGGGAQVGYRGFKYTVIEQYGGAEPNPTDGQAILWFQDDGEGGWYYEGIYIHYKDADGTSMSQIFSSLTSHGGNGQQPYILVNSAGVITLNEIRTVSYTAPFTKIKLTNSNGNQNNIGSSGSTCYFHFQTSPVVPTYSGYSMAGNLNGTTIPVGTNFIGIGSSTSNTTETNRSVPVALSQGNLQNIYVRTAGIMTGSMALSLMVNGSALPPAYTIPAGSAAGIYTFIFFANVTNGSNISIRVEQSTATSSGILTFGWIAR